MKSRKPLIPDHFLYELRNDAAYEQYLNSAKQDQAEAISDKDKEMIDALESKLLYLNELLNRKDY